MTPLLTSTPGDPPTYSPSIAETFSWIPITGANRPLYAKAVYDISNTASLSILPNLLVGWTLPAHDYIQVVYSGSNISVVNYRNGGVGGLIVASLSTVFSDGKLVGVSKTP